MRKIYSVLAIVFIMVITGCGSSSDSTPPPQLSSEKAITEFSLAGVIGTIDETEKTIAVNLPSGTSVIALVAIFTTTGVSVTVDSTAQESGETDNDFTSPVVYTVTAADNSTQDYTVTVTVAKSSEKALTAFSLGGVVGTIDETEKTIAVNLPSGTSVTALVATFTTTGARVTVDSIVQESGETDNDFRSPVVYTVSAADNSTQNYTVTVTVAKSWGMAAPIETDNAGAAGAPQVAMDASGNAVAVWDQYDGTRINIWSNRYTTGTGWGTATLIETDNAGDAHSPQVAMDASGNAVAVWQQSDGMRHNIWSNRYTAGTGWGTATLIENNVGGAGSPKVDVDASGNAMAVWCQIVGMRINIWSNRYTTGTGWGTATLIETNNAGDAFQPQVSMDASGNAVAVWFEYDGMLNICSNRYTAGAGWGTATLIETNNAGNAYVPQVAMDASGNAVAVWQQSDGMRNNIWSNRYTAGTGWGTATLITNNEVQAYSPQVDMDATGNAVMVWRQIDDTQFNIGSNRYAAGTGWGSAELIGTDNAEDAVAPQVALDASGNAVAVWRQNDGTRNNIWSNTYR